MEGMFNHLPGLLAGPGRATALASATALAASLLAAPTPAAHAHETRAGHAVQDHVAPPFPTDPGAFFATALKKVYGPTIRLKWHSDAVVLKLGGEPSLSPAHGTLTVNIGDGWTRQNPTGTGASIGVSLDLVEFSGTFTAPNAPLREISSFAEVPVPLGELASLRPICVTHKFTGLGCDRQELRKLIAEYQRDPARFFRRFLRIYFPAQNTLDIPLRAVNRYGRVMYSSSDLALRNGNLLSFPPHNAGYYSAKEVGFTDEISYFGIAPMKMKVTTK
ncbi:hypothetical protein Acor_75190 [Acrocarpospora corrugata]|uniref:Uncharacterized protein n=1 Tax=Acrocarpospora corrugata TaxID=35763 RepID=A0A5M3WEF1_9ACTN|nr:hypothetical protein [Acrocarpospora corrugata]GES05451.1 hypothetical protein Acor_75190 [Acrocarpospora corrugata]